MSTLLLTDREHPEVITAQPRRARTWLWARARGVDLDRALAAGACPDLSAPLSLRAELLLKESTRRDIARSLRRLLDEVGRPDLSPVRTSVPLCRRKIRRSSGTLLELARRLESGTPVDVRGIALVRALFSSGSGPFYAQPQADDLEPALRGALAALDITP